MSSDDVTQEGPVLAIGNEFTTVWVRKIRTRNGERLEIHTPDQQATIRIDPMQLEALSSLSPEGISRLFSS
ncbi:dihydrodiol dehydrogenase [Streptomyces mirabilis]|uniref:dihydrodiol dehydrogenase n=1 Tax=Streptomyces sp. NPDC005388 TaxID=3156717 RepID=UPI0033B2DAF9